MSNWILEVIEGPSSGLRIAVDEPLELGRAARGGRLDDEQVSRHHARVEPTDDAVRITDLHSTNGTHVRGRPIAGPRLLRSGDTVRLGITVMRLARAEELAGVPARARIMPSLPDAGAVLRPAEEDELSAANSEAQEDAIIRAQELKLTVIPSAPAADLIGAPAPAPPTAPALRGPLSRLHDAQVASQARSAAAILLGSSALSVILYYVLR